MSEPLFCAPCARVRLESEDITLTDTHVAVYPGWVVLEGGDVYPRESIGFIGAEPADVLPEELHPPEWSGGPDSDTGADE